MGNLATAGSPGHSPSYDDFRSLEEKIEAWEAKGRLPRIQPIRRTRSQVIKTRTNRESHSQPLSELTTKNNHQRPDMIPEPDYSDSEEDKDRKGHQSRSRARSTSGIHYSEEGLILPKKPANPCLESSERQNLHRELLFNQRMGKNVLNQKTELQKALAKFKDEQKKKAIEEEKQNKRTALEKKLEEQASKIKQYEDENEEKPQKKDDSEFLKVHAKVRSQMIS
ncbi:actin cytoskeleton-regulatory complex protein PAN1-like isoform X2 [Limulus polyphemus]|uniref:Actin cytoskeleton-regulatory complex protein PAN1-like isoform X2 n=1 Tax=Limulus polyphemus TaxID=6850 RepID=A0ABM1SUE0_LIMPO|nr:actin cytoskeleton-regulatory complex protein PAN1-like isoform X2 [Limulus polyphemus]